MNEIWQDLKNYEGLYKISTNGELRGINGKILTGWEVNEGYKKVRLYKNKQYKDFYVHRLVALQFIPSIQNKKVVNHIDSNPSNNNVKNLEWCTQKENMEHAKKNNRLNRNGIKIRRKSDGKVYISIHEAAMDNNMIPNTILYQFRRKSTKCNFEICTN